MTHPSKMTLEPERIKRKSRNRKVVIGFFLFLGVVVVLESPLARVRGFTVSGNRSISAGELLKDTTLRTGMSLWQVNGAQVQSQIRAHEPLVDKVTVHTSLTQGVVSLQVFEKKVVALYESSGKFYTLLSDGVIYTPVASSNGFYYPIVTSTVTAHLGQVVSPDVQVLCRQMSLQGSPTNESVSQVRILQNGVATVYLNNGFVGQCSVSEYEAALVTIHEAVQYFLSRGYPPGMVDMTGAPPYRYTPFSKPSVSKSKTGG
jgi:cell division protein FtsQ